MTSSIYFPDLKRQPAALDETGLPKRIVAVSDIHGMSGHFDRLVGHVSKIAGFDDAAYFILGDMVDRGHNARGVLDRVATLLKRRDGSRCLIGNHDLWFRDFLRGELHVDEIENWLEQGGAETLQSYGIARRGTPETMREQVLGFAPEHLGFLEAAEPIVLLDSFAFVHAGVDPRRSMDQQTTHDCAWIRAPFMRHTGPLSHIVVHGHTPQKGKRPTLTENRVSIDTGACFGGLLTAALIDRQAQTMDFVATDGVDVTIRAPTLTDRGHGTVADRYPPTAGGYGLASA